MQMRQIYLILVNLGDQNCAFSFQGVWTLNGESLVLIEVDNGHRLYIVRMVNNLELI